MTRQLPKGDKPPIFIQTGQKLGNYAGVLWI